MNGIVIGVIALVAFLIIMVLGVPVPYAMIATGFLGIAAYRGIAVAGQMMATDLFTGFSTYTYITAPFFSLMGFFAFYSGMGSNMFGAVNSFIGHKKGGLAMATEVASAAFGAICGSAIACIGTMCSLAYPEMRKKNYHPALAANCITAGSTLSVLIPPSTSFIIYGVVTEVSVGQLFVSGIIPGIVLMLFFMGAIAYMVKKNPEYGPASEKATKAERREAIRKGSIIEIIIVFVISMGGMFIGLFTPTEAGAVGALGMFLVTVFTRRMDWKRLKKAVIETIRVFGMFYMLLACAKVFGHMFTVTGVASGLSRLVASLNVAPVIIMAAIIAIYFVLGLFCDMVSIELITLPIFFPIVTGQLGFNPLWFGTIMILVSAIGSLTPPVGTGTFITKGCINWDKEATLSVIFSGVWPFVIVTVLMIVLIIFVPAICTLLPHLVYGTPM